MFQKKLKLQMKLYDSSITQSYKDLIILLGKIVNTMRGMLPRVNFLKIGIMIIPIRKYCGL